MTVGSQMQADQWVTTGQRLESGGDLQGAVNAYQQALSLLPDDGRILGRLGTIAYRTGQLSRAESFLLRALDKAPDDWTHHQGLGNVYKRQGRLEQAEASLQRAVSLAPVNGAVHYDLGIVYQIGGQLEKALASYRASVACDPEDARAWNNLGLIYLALEDRAQAITCFETAIAKQPDFAGAYANLGIIYADTGNHEKAVELSRRTIALDPHGFTGYHNLGNAFLKMDLYQQAISCFEQGLQRKHEHPEILNSLGVAYQKNGNPERAIACFQRVIAFKPDSEKSYIHLYNQLRQVCDWSQAGKVSRAIDTFTKSSMQSGTKPSEPPFMSVCRDMDEKRHLEIARLWSREIEHAETMQQRCMKSAVQGNHRRRLCVGYLTNNYRNHPTTHLLCDLFKAHNRDRFRIHAYSCGRRSGNEYARIVQENSDRFTELYQLNDRDAADRIAADRVDILVDLNGYSDGHRMSLYAFRPAPLQVRYLGMAGTTGSEFFDYLISDRIVTPESAISSYSEKFVLMPHTYQVNSYRSQNDHAQRPVREEKRPHEKFIFCCFCSNYKLEPEIFQSWMQILKRVPESRLWLLGESRAVARNLREAAAAEGVDPRRLRFGEKKAKKDHLSRLGQAHLGLDTMTVNGAATTSDALWAGVPVITLKGRHFASRMSASILTALGLSELITGDLRQYENLAVELATDGSRLDALTKKLEGNKWSEPLFDTHRFVRNLENAFFAIWNDYQEGRSPRHIRVVEDGQSHQAGARLPEINDQSTAHTVHSTSQGDGPIAATHTPYG